MVYCLFDLLGFFALYTIGIVWVVAVSSIFLKNIINHLYRNTYVIFDGFILVYV